MSYSEGEVCNLRKSRVAGHSVVKSGGRLLQKSRGAAAALPVMNFVPSPGEFHFPQETRDGIDVINISRQSSSSFGAHRRKPAGSSASVVLPAKAEKDQTDSVEDGSILESRRKLRVRDSAPVVHIKPPQLLTVESYSTEAVAKQITVTEKPSPPMQTAAKVSTEYQKSNTSGSISISEIPILPETSSKKSRLQPKLISTDAHHKERTSPANKTPKREVAAPQLQPVQVVIRPPITVTVPTGLGGDDPSASATSVTYSNDFGFSSLSIPGLD